MTDLRETIAQLRTLLQKGKLPRLYVSGDFDPHGCQVGTEIVFESPDEFDGDENPILEIWADYQDRHTDEITCEALNALPALLDATEAGLAAQEALARVEELKLRWRESHDNAMMWADKDAFWGDEQRMAASVYTTCIADLTAALAATEGDAS